MLLHLLMPAVMPQDVKHVQHLQAKVLVFVSTCKQASFLYEAFRRLRPGTPLRSLHGSMKQPKRMAIYYSFCQVGFELC